MTYQSPGLERRSAFSAAAGSTSSGSAGSSGAPASAAVSAATSVTGSALAVSGASSAVTSCNAASMSTVSLTGRSPSEIVTVMGPSLICQLVAASAEHPQHQLGQAQIHQADERHHEHQERQHHRGVRGHLLAVRPDDLAQLGDDLLEVGEDEDERVARGPVGLAGLLGFLRLLGRPVVGVALGELDGARCLGPVCGLSPLTGPLAGGSLRRRHGRTTALRVASSAAVGCGVGIDVFVAHRMLLRSIVCVVVTFQCPPLQVRQDLNLQPAVLETAALPVELRPFAGWQANLRVSGPYPTRALAN